MIDQFILSLITGIFIGGVSGFLGSLMLQKRMALVAGPLGHLALPGIVLALLYGFNVSLGAFPFIILGIVLIWLFELRTKLPMEVLTAVVFASGVAISFLFLPIEQAETALIGDISKVDFRDAIISAILALLIFLIIIKIFPKMTLINISEDLAKVEGINVKKYNLIYLGCIAIVVALGVKLVGGLLTAALVAIPAATARNLSRSIKEYSFLSMFLGIISVILGIFIFKFSLLPPGPMIILASAFFFLISLIFKRS